MYKKRIKRSECTPFWCSCESSRADSASPSFSWDSGESLAPPPGERERTTTRGTTANRPPAGAIRGSMISASTRRAEISSSSSMSLVQIIACNNMASLTYQNRASDAALLFQCSTCCLRSCCGRILHADAAAASRLTEFGKRLRAQHPSGPCANLRFAVPTRRVKHLGQRCWGLLHDFSCRQPGTAESLSRPCALLLVPIRIGARIGRVLWFHLYCTTRRRPC